MVQATGSIVGVDSLVAGVVLTMTAASAYFQLLVNLVGLENSLLVLHGALAFARRLDLPELTGPDTNALALLSLSAGFHLSTNATFLVMENLIDAENKNSNLKKEHRKAVDVDGVRKLIRRLSGPEGVPIVARKEFLYMNAMP
jgi:hypothetical protein